MLIFSLFTPAFAAADKHVTFKNKQSSSEKLEKMKEIIEQQEKLLESEPTIHPALLKEQSGDSMVSVIIQFSEAPVSLAKGKKMVQQQSFTASDEKHVKKTVQSQHEVFSSFTKKHHIPFDESYSYDTVLNGISGNVKASDLEKLLEVPGIRSIEPNTEVYALETPQESTSEVTPFMDQTVPHLDIEKLWDKGITGQGVKVAVLDTGIDYNHPEFEGVYKGGHNFIPHNADLYSEERADDDPYETYPGERAEGAAPEKDGRSFETTHGTHVAGTIAAQGNNSYGIKGIAPDIELYAYRVLGAYGSGSTAGIIAAIEMSVEEEMDIINLSLGGGSNSEHTADAAAINNAALEGVTSIIATGNAGPGRGSIGNPATATLGIAVGNSTPPEEFKQASVHVEAGSYSNESVIELMAWNYGSNPEEDLQGEHEIVAIPGYGEPEDFEGLDVEGKVALISRGDIPFVDKIAAARDAGAIGTLIHNNVDSGPANVFLSTAFDFIPSFDMATTEGEALREALEDSSGYVSFGEFETTASEGNEMTASSSQGPSTPNFDIKPDVVAPGTNIMSSVPAFQRDYPDADYGMAYDRATGTSMATPHVAGVAALVKSANPEFDPFDIKVALSNTAKLLDTEAYDVFIQGAGLVQPLAAVEAEAYAYVIDTAVSEDVEIENIKGTITFGNVETNPDEETTLTKEIELRNMSGDASTYDISVEVTKEATGDFADATVTVDQDSVSLGDSDNITVSLNVPATDSTESSELLGYIHISNGTTDLSLPFAAAFGESSGTGSDIGYAYLDDYAIAIGSDGTPNMTSFNFQLLDIQYITYVELWDASDPDGGVYGDGAIGQLGGGQFLSPGNYFLEVNGDYLDYETEEEMVASDGVYSIDLITMNLLDGVSGEWDGPFYIKSTNPEISFDEIDPSTPIESLSGVIDDQFIDFKSIVENAFGIPYDANEHLTTTFEVSHDDEVVLEDETLLAEDGSFTIDFAALEAGAYTLTLFSEDRLGHTAEASIDFVIEETETIDVTLTPSTTEPTEDPVTIEVSTNSESELTSMKWLAGEKEVGDFAEDGEVIDLETSAFDVDENGAYTVYVQNENGTEAVGTIHIRNIGSEVETFSIELTPSPTEQTEGPVSIEVDTDSEATLTSLKWLQGDHDVDAFVENGENIALDQMTFDVDENAIYTVFAENADGVQVVQTIAITNILNLEASDFELSFELSPSDLTEGPVTITVDSTSETELTSLQWLPGVHHSPDAFEEGNDINLDMNAFDVEENGYYTVFAQNSEEEMAIDYVEVTNIIEEEDPVSFNVSLNPSTTEETEGPVSIHVTHDSESPITEAKWLPGEKTTEDFAEDGTGIDLEQMFFDVTENGTYSVYVLNEDGVEVVSMITINNIIETSPEPTPAPIAVEFEFSKTDPTEEPITVTVHATSEADITEVKWLEGRPSLDDIKENGHTLDLDSTSFVLTKNGTYSVYVQNSDGTEVLKTFTITNIIDESNGDPNDPDEPDVPGEPADPNPCIPCDGDGGDGSNGDANNGGPKDNNGSTDGTTSSGDGSTLPKTATNTFNVILFGVILTIIGGLSAYALHRRKQNVSSNM